MPPLRVYVDSSVFGGYFEDEFANGSRRFFEHVRSGRIVALISDFVVDELMDAGDRDPGRRDRLLELPAHRPLGQDAAVQPGQSRERFRSIDDRLPQRGTIRRR